MQKRIFRSKSTTYHLPPTNSGFTIVELIVVVAVIVILSAIFMVSYNSAIQNSVKSSLQTGLKNASKQLVVDQIRSSTGVFPATLAAANSGGGISFSPGMTVSYTVDNSDTPKTFCLSASQNSQSYFINQEANPLPGPCPVLYLDASIPNSYPGTGTAWNDLSGNGNNGTMYGDVTYSSASGGSLIFDGAGDYVNAGTDASLGVTLMTIEGWVYLNAYNSDTNVGQVIAGSYNGVGYIFYLVGTGAKLGLRLAGGTGTNDVHSSNDLALNTWYYVAGTYDGTNIKIYVNANQKGSVAYSSPTGNAALIIGKASWYSGLYFNGQIGGIRLYNKALSTDEITQNFNALRSRYGI